MRGGSAVVGVYTYLDDALKAVEIAKSRGADYRVYSPVPNHEIDHATSHDRSNVRIFTLIGAVTGLVGGFTLAIMTSLDYPLRTSAKEIVSIPGFVVVGYECTILFGALATLTGLLHFCRLPDILRKVGYDPRFSQDKFGVVVGCSKKDSAALREELAQTGADEVEVRDAL